jgi:sporulation protein YlmC with PRC-barrel domain
MASYSYTFQSGDSVTPERLNNARTVSDIVDVDISATAEIAVSKLSDGAARQLLQTDAAGTGVEWTSNVDVQGTLDVTGATTLDSTLSVAGAVTTTSTATLAHGVVVTGSSTGNAVRITQEGTGNALVVEDSANPDSTPVVIDASGNTVIGHTAAVAVGGATQPLLVNGAGISVAKAAADTSAAALTFAKSRSTSLGATRAIVSSGDTLGTINFAGDNGANLSVIGAAIAAAVDGTAGSADMPARLVLSTTPDGSAAPVERMRITEAGNVGIGKTPSTKLDVDGTVTATTFVGALTGTASAIADSVVTDAKVSNSAAIAHSKLANITAGQVLMGNASNSPTATALSGDVTVNSSGVTAIGSGVIVDADVSASAGIAHTKLANITAGSVLMGNASNAPTATALSGDVTVNSSGVTAIGSGVIVNADVSASAGIAHSKLANITAGQVMMGNASNVPTSTALSGDVTVNSSGVTAIGSGVIVDADVNASAAIGLSKLATGALPSAITVASANLVDGTIVNADINAAAAIDLSKLATGALPTAITVASANLVDGTIVNDDISASAGIVDTKLATISTAGKVSNSATTATSANTANAIVARDGSGNFSAGQVTASTARIGASAGSTYALEVDGNANLAAGGAYRIGNTKIIEARKTGWSDPTGTASRATFATSTVTTEQLAQRLKALIDDLTSHGLIGA